jgi:SAM-dependent methyltransferase
MGERPRFHRKQWEFVYIAHSLFERGYLAPGKSGIGFGVGKEPLVDLFVSFGCKVTATDLSPEEAAGTGWIESNQHSSNKDALYKGISSTHDFENLVDFRDVNMNNIPSDLPKYDFCYSSCSIEHVGSLSKSLDFLMNSVELLKPGGISIHTTELNLTSNDETIDHGETVIWRRKDFARLSEKLLLAGHSIEPFDFFAGSGKINEYIDLAPYKSSPHLRLKLGKFASTSFGVIVRKGNGAVRDQS